MDTQLETLRLLPTTMQWRGIFNSETQYLKNDIVVGGTTRRTYVCIVVAATLGFTDPTPPEWYEFTGGTSGIHSLDLGAGLSNSGTATSVILDNAGVIDVIAGSNIFLSGTAQNRIVNSLSLTGFIAGLGITTAGSNITNNGIQTIRTGGGLFASPGPDVQLNLNNILSVSTSVGISNVGTALNPIIENTWVRTLTLIDIANTGTTTDPILRNNGVESITNVDGSVQITPSPLTLSCKTVPQSIKIFDASTVSFTGWPMTTGNVAFLNFTVISPLILSAFSTAAVASVIFNMSAFNFKLSSALGISPINVYVYDSTTNYTLFVQRINRTSETTVANIGLGEFSVSIPACIASGLTQISGLKFTPTTQLNPYSFAPLAYGSGTGVFRYIDLV
jgi:hypothetical protein